MPEKLSSQHQRWFERHVPEGISQRRHRFRMGLAKTAVAMTALLAYGHADIQTNKDVQANSEVSIDVRSESVLPDDDLAIVLFGGYGSVNATVDAANIGSAFQAALGGDVLSVNYNDALLDPAQIAEEIVETVEESNNKNVVLVGRSAGGITATETLVELLKLDRDFDIRGLALVSTPYGYDGLREDKQQLIDLTSLLEYAPDLAYSSGVRFWGEVAIRHAEYNTGTPTDRLVNFINTAERVNRAIDRGYVPGVWLRVDQLLTIQNANLKQDFAMIGQDWSEVPPTVMYFGTENPGYDDTVNDAASAEKIGEFARNAGLTYLDYYVPNAIHNQPEAASEEYRQVLQLGQEAIIASFAKNQALYDFRQLKIQGHAPYLIPR